MGMFGLLVILTLSISFATAVEFAERARLRKLLDRVDTEAIWRDCFPEVPADEIRSFLVLFTESFAIDPTHCFKFAPDDRPSAIYEARYVPHLTVDDHCEFESLTDALASRHRIDLQAVWRDDITLGELFAMTRKDS